MLRVSGLLLALAVIGCGPGEEPVANVTPVDVVASPAAEPELGPPSIPTEDDAHPAPRVAIEGYGVHIGLRPPFMINRGGGANGGIPDRLTIAHADATHRVQSLTIVPAIASDEGADLEAVVEPERGFRVGEDGTRITIGLRVDDVADLITLAVGPREEHWVIVSDDVRVPWPEDKLLRSSNAPMGPGYSLVDRPRLGRPGAGPTPSEAAPRAE